MFSFSLLLFSLVLSASSLYKQVFPAVEPAVEVSEWSHLPLSFVCCESSNRVFIRQRERKKEREGEEALA